MNSDMMRAGQLLISGGFTCVLYRSGVSFTSRTQGLKPLLRWLDSDTDFSGFFAADKIVGSGAAWLYIHLRVRGVYARTMTIAARDCLFAHGIAVVCDNYTDRIVNRQGTGPCPFEAAVAGLDDANAALSAIRETALALFGDWSSKGDDDEASMPDPVGSSMADILKDLIKGQPVETLSQEDLAALSEESPLQ